MSVSTVIGPTESLTKQRVAFTAVSVLTGERGTVHFNLREATGISTYVSDYSYVLLDGDLTVSINAPTSSTISYHAHVCVIPEEFKHNGIVTRPSGAAQVLTVPGSCSIQRSELVASPFVTLGFPEDIAHQLKPATILGAPPQIVCSWTSEGTTPTSAAHLLIRGTIQVSGVGFRKTW
jgi:hypothetical protein